ncbi:MAG: hypothetical protein RLY24_474 [Actinomycetota bacterium]|jgi:uncharacterized cupredoxin-like copper-binding protein
MKLANRVSLAFIAAVMLASCGADPSSQPGVDVDDKESNKVVGQVSEWAIEVSAGKAKAGEVIFAIANYGTIQHEFLVTKTSFEPGKIPLGENNRFDEELEGIEVIDEIPEWPVNEAKVLKIDLEPGTYELLCNIEGHYANGMHHTFIVE